MEILFLKSHHQHLALPSLSYMSPLSSSLKPQILLSCTRFRFFCAPVSVQFSETVELIEAPTGRKSSNSRARVKVSDAQLKDNWLSSLSRPIPAKMDPLRDDDELTGRNDGSDWVIGIDPDVSGALALLRTDLAGCSAQISFPSAHLLAFSFTQSHLLLLPSFFIVALATGPPHLRRPTTPATSLVGLSTVGSHLSKRNSDSRCGGDEVDGLEGLCGAFIGKEKRSNEILTAKVFDSPYIQMLVGKRVRKRLDPKSIVQLVTSLEAPMGTVAYIEQSTPFPKDGKLGWWSGGFGYGLWIGILVASGFSVVPVSSSLWKNGLELSGSRSNKDSSRNLASELFPSLSSMLKRKKDHGRAEALLIAAYGQRCRVKPDEASIPQELQI